MKRVLQRALLATACFGFIVCSAVAEEVAAPAVLLEYEGVEVTRHDVEQYVEYRLPPEQRQAFWANDRHIRELIANIYVNKVLAKEARELGLDRKNAWAIEYQVDRMLAAARMAEEIESARDAVDFEALARETYLANKDRFTSPEQVQASHILISTTERDDAAAREQAEAILDEVRANPESFAELAEAYSEDPSAVQNKGDLGFFPRGAMVPEFEKVAFSLSPGEVSDLVRTDFGYHIIKVSDRRDPGLRSFDEVKDQLIRDERQKWEDAVRKREVERVKSLDGIQVNEEAVSSLIQRAGR